MELDYWGIDENLFKEKAKDKFELVQQLLDTPVLQIFERDENNQFFHKSLSELQTKKLNFKQLLEEKKLNKKVAQILATNRNIGRGRV